MKPEIEIGCTVMGKIRISIFSESGARLSANFEKDEIARMIKKLKEAHKESKESVNV